jgi:hypothetical protein
VVVELTVDAEQVVVEKQVVVLYLLMQLQL